MTHHRLAAAPLLALALLAGCGTGQDAPTATPADTPRTVTTPPTAPQTTTADTDDSTEAEAGGEEDDMNITAQIADRTFEVTLSEVSAAAELATLLPLILQMTDLNANEKYATLPRALPAEAERVGSIEAGDIMLYGADTLVIFYESFSTSYSYTRLGRIRDAAGLRGALGSGEATVTLR